jgi:hypothetical protein
MSVSDAECIMQEAVTSHLAVSSKHGRPYFSERNPLDRTAVSRNLRPYADSRSVPLVLGGHNLQFGLNVD